MMLQLLFTVAFSAVPLTLYIPPVRSLNLFVETMEDLLRESRVYTGRLYPRARHVWSRVLDILLCNFRLQFVVVTLVVFMTLCGIMYYREMFENCKDVI
ncbi:hypothetical protein D5086_017987 [Populus alba]|uniref:Uncharacterized protein n=1 Tax=Populus alba TaxID=43335 RepID=A0ACC4BNK2_POPAL